MAYTPPEGEACIRDLLANWGRFLHEEISLDPLKKLFLHPKLMTLLTRESNAFQSYR